MKTINELLQIVIDSLKEGVKSGWHNMGICGEIDDLFYNNVINIGEFNALRGLIKVSRPSITLHPEFFDAHRMSSLYWWENMWYSPETRRIRINFLTKLLNENS